MVSAFSESSFDSSSIILSTKAVAVTKSSDWESKLDFDLFFTGDCSWCSFTNCSSFTSFKCDLLFYRSTDEDYGRVRCDLDFGSSAEVSYLTC